MPRFFPVGFLVIVAAVSVVIPARAQAPANDGYYHQQTIPSVSPVSVTGTTVNATPEYLDPSFNLANPGIPTDAGIQGHTVWYNWTPPTTGILHVDLQRAVPGQSYVVFVAGVLDYNNSLTADGYAPGDGTAAFPAIPDFRVTAGQEYIICVGDTPDPTDFTLTLTINPLAHPLPVATLTASAPKVYRSTGSLGKFIVHLSKSASADLTVNVSVHSTALAGGDYPTLPVYPKVPAGATRAKVKNDPYFAGEGTGRSVVTATVEPGDGYTVGTPAKVKIRVLNSP